MTTQHSSFRFDRPGALIAALPAVLGFVPEKSLVLVSLESGQLGAVMRADLGDELVGDVSRLAELVASSGADAAVALVVDAEAALCPMCNDDHRQLCEELSAALAEHGVRLAEAHVVDRIETGGRWHCVDGCGAHGTVDDPGASPMAAAAVLDGRRLYGRRADLQAVVAAADPYRTAGLAAEIRAGAELRSARWTDDPDGCGRADVQRAMTAASRVGAGGQLEQADIVALACSLTDVAVRDTLYALAVGSEAASAESLWGLLARTLPEPWRVEALALLAFSAYARGDGPLAGISLDAALRADPGHRMAGMLDTALQSGMRPAQIRELATTGYRLAQRLGVELPPQQRPGRRAV